MRNRTLFSAFSVAVLLAGPAYARGLEIDKSIDVEKNIDISKKDVDVDVKKTDVDLDYDLDLDVKKTDVDVTKTDVDVKKTDVDVKKTDIDVKKTEVDIDKKEISDSFNKSVSVDASKELDVDVKKTLISKIEDSYNYSSSKVIEKSVFAAPVAEGNLSASVTHSVAGAKAFGKFGADAKYASGASIGTGAFTNFRGINSAAVNGGPNSVQQTNVSIAVVATTSY